MTTIGEVHDGGRTLAFIRTTTAAIEEVWATLTVSERLEAWFGTWTGDPSSGSVLVSMNAEGEAPSPSPFQIDACDAPSVLAVSSSDDAGRWVLAVTLAAQGSGTRIELRQTELDPAMVGDVAAGWDWYLDRLVAVLEGGTVPDLDAFERDYLPLGAEYAAARDRLTA